MWPTSQKNGGDEASTFFNYFNEITLFCYSLYKQKFIMS